MNLENRSDAELQEIIIRETRQPARHRTEEDLEEAEQSVEAAKAIISARHRIGSVGREGLPDQG